jgi:hypothetical protein
MSEEKCSVIIRRHITKGGMEGKREAGEVEGGEGGRG